MQSIIVYRNPLEAAIWEGIMSNGGAIFAFLLWVIVTVTIFAFIASRKPVERMLWRKSRSFANVFNTVTFGVSAIGAIFVMKYADIAFTWIIVHV